MTAIIIPAMGSYPFGAMTNQMVSRLIAANVQVERLQEAISTASSGYTGTPGTEFEAPLPTAAPGVPAPPANLFGIMADPDNPGAQGQAYSYAMGQLMLAWKQFWDAAKDYVEALDNGTISM